VELGPDATLDSWAGDWRAYRLRIFDHAVKGSRLDEPAVRVFVMGGGSGRRNAAGKLEHGGRWIAAADWPPPDVEFSPFHLHGNGTLARAAPPSGALPLSYDFDPSHPVPTIGGAMSSLDPVAHAGAWDQTEGEEFYGCTPPYLPLASRRDVLVFQTPPLDAPLQVVGPIETELYVATDGPDTDFTAKLIDVHPPTADYPKGYAMLLTDGILRLAMPRIPRDRGCASRARWQRSASRYSRPRTCSCRGIASGSTSPRAIFRSSMSTRTPANRRARRGASVLP
jgi:uncharacterized protein